jgi:transposase
MVPAVIPRGSLNQLGFPMWTPTTRQQHSRPVTRYQTDLTDAEWRVIAPHLPKPCATGRPREWPMREIVRKNPDQVGFAVNPRRWVVERFFAWIGRNRRLAKDFEATIDSARAFLYAASVMLLVRRVARVS